MHTTNDYSVITLYVYNKLEPVIFITIYISSDVILLTKNIFLFTKYCIAKSLIGKLFNTKFVSKFDIFSNFLFNIFNSASTIDWKSLGLFILNSEFSFL